VSPFRRPGLRDYLGEANIGRLPARLSAATLTYEVERPANVAGVDLDGLFKVQRLLKARQACENAGSRGLLGQLASFQIVERFQ
jgi:hypothetical protein